MSNGDTLPWTWTAGFFAQPAGTTMMYNVSRPLMQPGRVQQYRAWKYDSSLPYNPANEIVIGVGMYPSQLLAQQACQDDWNMNAPPVAAPGPVPLDDTMYKSVYDTNYDSIVDHAALADTAPWTGLTDKPVLDWSTTENWTGRLWVDGTSKVYQKTIPIGALPNSISSTAPYMGVLKTPHNIANMAIMVSAQLVLNGYSHTYFVPVAYVEPPIQASPNINPSTISFYLDLTNITVVVGKDQSAYNDNYCTVRYTCTNR